MSETNRVIINDNEAVRMFLNFYKLLFLGTPFSEKMLNIKIEEKKKNTKDNKYNVTYEEEEELKSDSGSFIIDTSDISSSDKDAFGPSGGYSSPSSNDSLTSSSDPYHKIKNHAILCLQYLFKFNNKALFNYWYLLFPSYLMKP